MSIVRVSAVCDQLLNPWVRLYLFYYEGSFCSSKSSMIQRCAFCTKSQACMHHATQFCTPSLCQPTLDMGPLTQEYQWESHISWLTGIAHLFCYAVSLWKETGLVWKVLVQLTGVELKGEACSLCSASLHIKSGQWPRTWGAARIAYETGLGTTRLQPAGRDDCVCCPNEDLAVSYIEWV